MTLPTFLVVAAGGVLAMSILQLAQWLRALAERVRELERRQP